MHLIPIDSKQILVDSLVLVGQTKLCMESSKVLIKDVKKNDLIQKSYEYTSKVIIRHKDDAFSRTLL